MRALVRLTLLPQSLSLLFSEFICPIFRKTQLIWASNVHKSYRKIHTSKLLLILRTILFWWWQPIQLFFRQKESKRKIVWNTRGRNLFRLFMFYGFVCIIHDKTSSNKSSSAIWIPWISGRFTYTFGSFDKINKGACYPVESDGWKGNRFGTTAPSCCDLLFYAFLYWFF